MCLLDLVGLSLDMPLNLDNGVYRYNTGGGGGGGGV